MKYIELSEVKALAPAVQSMEDYVQSLPAEEPTVILRNYDEPQTPPCMEEFVEVFDAAAEPRPPEDVKAAYGTKPNVPGVDVIKAIRLALGTGGYALHIADSSYTGYSVWEVHEFMRNFDHTNLRVWVPQAFDCDDFSQVLQGSVNGFFPGIAFGTIWYGPKEPPYNWGHSVNIFYSYTNDTVYLVEPQNDTFYKFNKDKWRPWMVIL